MSIWNDPGKKPKDGSIIAVLTQHWKRHKYLSSEIHFGEVSYSNDGKSWRAETNDMSGMGSWCPGSGGNMVAWTYAEDLDLPDYLPHDKHWGELNEINKTSKNYFSVWYFEDAPEEFRQLSQHGGDEDWIALIPNSWLKKHGDDVPLFLEEGSSLGCCSVSKHRTEAALILIGAHARNSAAAMKSSNTSAFDANGEINHEPISRQVDQMA